MTTQLLISSDDRQQLTSVLVDSLERLAGAISVIKAAQVDEAAQAPSELLGMIDLVARDLQAATRRVAATRKSAAPFAWSDDDLALLAREHDDP